MNTETSDSDSDSSLDSDNSLIVEVLDHATNRSDQIPATGAIKSFPGLDRELLSSENDNLAMADIWAQRLLAERGNFAALGLGIQKSTKTFMCLLCNARVTPAALLRHRSRAKNHAKSGVKLSKAQAKRAQQTAVPYGVPLDKFSRASEAKAAPNFVTGPIDHIPGVNIISRFRCSECEALRQ